MIFAACHIVFQVRQIEAELGRALAEGDVEPVTWACLQAAGQVPAAVLQGAIDHHRHAAVRYAAWWDLGYDLLLTPTIAVPPYPLGSLTAPTADDPIPDVAPWVPFTPHVNAAGLPAVSLPLWWNAKEQPIGVQLVGRYGCDDLLLRVAAQVESARPWGKRTPAVFALDPKEERHARR
jgi:amidase